MSVASPPVGVTNAPTRGVEPSPKRRRKRAPTAGAAGDCFTCAALDLHCDRRRPYCSQCLDHGKDCSGYKTKLTWGVGVASRGKLRGLSLPVAGAERLSTSIPVSKLKKRGITSPRKTKSQPVFVNPFAPNTVADTTSPDSKTETPFTTPSTITNGPPSSTTSWHPSPHVDVLNSASLPLQAEQHVLTSTPYQNLFSAHRSDSGEPYPKRARGSMEFLSPSESNLNYSSYHQTESLHPVSAAMDLSESNTIETQNNYWTIAANYASSMPTTHVPVLQQTFDQGFADQPISVSSASSHAEIQNWRSNEADEEIGRGNLQDESAIADDLAPYSVALIGQKFGLNLSPFIASNGIGKTPRMQYLINYYTEVISPVIVAFDSPTNPYRIQILRLAARSETLQHAISALSASNLRQRRATGWVSTCKTDPARRSSIAHMTLADESLNTGMKLSEEDQVREEKFHRGMAIKTLNAQLADPVRRKDDSTLAILLILCLFHICDSGVAKFQTQFAGVKKLLKMRGEDVSFKSDETKWFTRMFTWFDAMTATVNDREGQLQGYHLDISALSDEEWALENLAGCDGKLFKTIAKLGRLNVLSQGKPVESSPLVIPSPVPTTVSHSHFDGNGWARILGDEDLFNQKTRSDDVQTQFWREWREIRRALQTWQLDTSIFDSTSAEAPLLTAEQKLDLANISESFRYSALLYTERLSAPAAPSSDPKIQVWVQKSLEFIKQVKSDVYLLWPLFITGSECMNTADRNIIRERCLDIQKDSGFSNNASCLELLEKVWRDHPVEGRDDRGEGGFKFSHVMRNEGNEGEYIVV